jgi:hypothetical protein
VTTRHDFGGVLGWPLDTVFWGLTISWSRLLARVWSGPKRLACMLYSPLSPSSPCVWLWHFWSWYFHQSAPTSKEIHDTATFNFPAHGQNTYELGSSVKKERNSSFVHISSLTYISPTNSPPTHIGVGHQWTVSTSTGYNQWLSLAKPTLKVPPVGRKRSVVAHTAKCGWATRLWGFYRVQPSTCLLFVMNLFDIGLDFIIHFK